MTFPQVALAFLPEIVLVAGALLIFLIDSLGGKRLELLGAIALGAGVLALLLVVADLRFSPLVGLATVPLAWIDPGPAPALYTFTSLGLVFQGIFLLTTILVALASTSRPRYEPGAAVFFGLLLLATTGMLLVAVAADLIFLLLAIEVVGISTYLLVGYTRKDGRELEAAMKFYIIGALSTALSFFGASLLFGAFGSTSFYSLAQGAGPTAHPTLALVGYGLLIAGLGFKATLVPFHAWAVDVYDGAPSDVSAFLAGGSKKVGIFAIFLLFLIPVAFVPYAASHPPCPLCPVRVVFFPPIDFGPTLQAVLAVLAVLTMTVGNLLALQQREMKRMLAYSSISQAGYMLIGVAVGTAPALAGATLQVFAHVFMKAGAFLVVGAVAALGIGPLITDWRGLGARRPFLSVAFALMLLSLAGVPLTIGFVSKFVLFSAAVQAQQYFVWLAVAGLLNSALSVFYYARVLKVMFMDTAEPAAAADTPLAALGNGLHAPPLPSLGWGRMAAVGLAAVVIVALGIDPQPVLGPIQSAATHFLTTGA